MTTTANLALPYIEAAQAQKHVTHNEALRLLDTLVQLAVADRDLNTPPGSPTEGQRWIVKASPAPTGAWAGHGNHIAAWQDGGWQFSVPKTGWLAYIVDETFLAAWNGTAWVNALAAFQNIPMLGVNTAADSTNKLAVKSNAVLLNNDDVTPGSGDIQVKVNKSAAGRTASFLFQDAASGRAEVGLTGDDNFHFKVSPDGSSWLDAIILDRTTGKATLLGFTDPTATRVLLSAAPIDALAHNGLQINGGMEVTQENGTNAVTLTASGALQTKYLLDGVMAHYRGTFVATAQQVASSFVGCSKSLKITVGTAQASLGANDELSIVLPIEGYRVSRLAYGGANAVASSIGFWAKFNRAGTYSGSLRNSAKNRSYPFNLTINSANTAQWISLTNLVGDTSGTWLNDNGVGLYLTICLAGGSSRVGTANTWAASDLSGATSTTNGVAATSDVFEVGGLIFLPGIELPDSVRAPFVLRPFDQELILCKRYWQLAMGAVANLFTPNLLNAAFAFAPAMRANPTCAIVNGTNGIDLPGVAAYNITGVNSVFGAGKNSSLVQLAHSGAGTGVGEVFPERLSFNARL